MILKNTDVSVAKTLAPWHGESFAKREINIEVGTLEAIDVVGVYVVNGDTIEKVPVSASKSKDPRYAYGWHTPQNEREYQKSPQQSLWRTAKELKMDQYNDLDMYDLVHPSQVPEGYKVYKTIWVYKIKLDEKRALNKLAPRWCVKGTAMDREVYKSFSEMMRMTSFKIVLCIKASYYLLLCEFSSDVSDAFQSTVCVRFRSLPTGHVLSPSD